MFDIRDVCDLTHLERAAPAPVDPLAGQRALAGSILGTGIGAHVDLGHTDQEILERCANYLRAIRALVGSPVAAGALQTIVDVAREA